MVTPTHGHRALAALAIIACFGKIPPTGWNRLRVALLTLSAALFSAWLYALSQEVMGAS